MKQLISNTILVATLIGNPHALAGAGGHGGVGFECKAENIPFQLFDFFQASLPGIFSADGLIIPRTQTTGLTPDQVEHEVQREIGQAFAKLAKLDPDLARWAKTELDRVAKRPGKNLQVLDIENDDRVGIPKKCRNASKNDGLTGIMVWHDHGLFPHFGNWLEVDYKKLHKLPITDQAGTWVHEAVFRVERLMSYAYSREFFQMGDLLSSLTPGAVFSARGITGVLFSTIDGIPKDGSNLAAALSTWFFSPNYTVDYSVSSQVQMLVDYSEAQHQDCSKARFQYSDLSMKTRIDLPLGQRVTIDLKQMGSPIAPRNRLITFILYDGSQLADQQCVVNIQIFDKNGNPVVGGPMPTTTKDFELMMSTQTAPVVYTHSITFSVL